eukprot:scaffold141914_cov37-Cyclotella_meneghiniana.AAC.2
MGYCVAHFQDLCVSTKTALTLSEEKTATGRPHATEFVLRVESKVCTIFEPAVPLEGKTLLSAQLHYDWGLRAIMSVFIVAGGVKRAEPEFRGCIAHASS